ANDAVVKSHAVDKSNSNKSVDVPSSVNTTIFVPEELNRNLCGEPDIPLDEASSFTTLVMFTM
ncbi:MAG: hypothetical protein ACO3N7_07045, partial [Kiritimatiellia bacterium]